VFVRRRTSREDDGILHLALGSKEMSYRPSLQKRALKRDFAGADRLAAYCLLPSGLCYLLKLAGVAKWQTLRT
jgi:hypothetical protein